MTKKLLLAIALAGVLPVAGALPLRADDPPPAESGGAAQPEDPDAEPYPPDGVTDPNVTYPVDGAESAGQGEDGAAPQAPADGPASGGSQPDTDGKPD